MPLIKYNYRYVTVLNRFIISNNCNQIRFFNKLQGLLVLVLYKVLVLYIVLVLVLVLVLVIFLDLVLYLFIVLVSVLVLVLALKF